MKDLSRRQRSGYFKRDEGAPAPVRITISRSVHFNEVDAMAVVWHGHYPRFFEEAAAALGRRCGLAYRDYYEAKIHAPIVQLHVDYHRPLLLDESFTIEAAYIWNEGARLQTEYAVTRADGSLAVTGFTVQMFVDAVTKEALLTSPPILEKFHQRWRSGEWK